MDNQILTTRHVTSELSYEFHHYHYNQPIDFSSHKHFFYEIYLFISGNVNYIIEDYTYQPCPGDILFINHNKTHYPKTNSFRLPCECFILWLNEAFFNHLYEIGEELTTCFKDASEKNYYLLQPTKTQINKIWKTCETIEHEQRNQEFGNHIIAYSYIVELFVLLSRAYYKTPVPIKHTEKNKLMNLIIAYINEHLIEDLTLEQLANQFHISKYHLSHQFKEYTGFSPYQYIMKKRLSTAYRMLDNGKSVTLACMESGFNDYSNFLKAFKREFGRNPSEFAKSS